MAGSSLLIEMMSKKKKPPTAPSDPSEGAEPAGLDDAEPDEGDDAKSLAFDALADALGISPDKRAGAQAALESFVSSCSMKE